MQKIDAEKQQIAQQLDQSNSQVNDALEAVETLIQIAQEKSIKFLEISNSLSSGVDNEKQANRKRSQEMVDSNNGYAKAHSSFADMTRQAQTSSEADVGAIANNIGVQEIQSAMGRIEQSRSLQTFNSERVLQDLEGLTGTKFESFRNEIRIASTDVREEYEQVRNSLQAKKSDSESARDDRLTESRSQMGSELDAANSSLTELGELTRQMGTTLGEGIDSVSTLAQSSAVGLTTALGALNSTWEVLEEIKNAWNE
ncbi:MAG: hypothetical protein AAFP81_07245 [Pseudomonadota bacterium]